LNTEPNWLEMDHRLTPDKEKWVVMLCQAAGADNELKILTRFQKVINAIYAEKVAPLEKALDRIATGECIRDINCDWEMLFGDLVDEAKTTLAEYRKVQ